MPTAKWLESINPDAPVIIRHLSDQLGLLRQRNPSIFPDLRSAETILAISDYSNDDAKDTYQGITFLIVDWLASGYSNILRSNFRSEVLDLKREFQFKKLNKDTERLRLLSDYLDTFNSLKGIVFTFLVHKNIRYLFAKSPHQVLKKAGLGNWKPHIAEKVLRILHFQALLVYGLSRPGQKYLWMTDRDAITNNIELLGELLQRVFNIYAGHGFSPFGYAEPLGDLSNPYRDYLSVPDLVGGAMLELIRNQHGDYDPDLEGQTLVQEKSAKILKWIATRNSSLKWVGCRIYGTDEEHMVSLFSLSPAGQP